MSNKITRRTFKKTSIVIQRNVIFLICVAAALIDMLYFINLKTFLNKCFANSDLRCFKIVQTSFVSILPNPLHINGNQ